MLHDLHCALLLIVSNIVVLVAVYIQCFGLVLHDSVAIAHFHSFTSELIFM